MYEKYDLQLIAVELVSAQIRLRNEIHDVGFDIADYFDTDYRFGMNQQHYHKLLQREAELNNTLCIVSRTLALINRKEETP